MTFRPRLLLVGLIVAGALLFLLTPLGPWLTLAALQQFASDWELAAERVGGRFLGTVRFAGLRLSSEAADSPGTSVAIERLVIAPWAYSVRAKGVLVELSESGETASQSAEPGPPGRLPLAYLPNLAFEDAGIRYRAAGTGLNAEGVALDYRAATATLTVTADAWSYSAAADEPLLATGKLDARFELSPSVIGIHGLTLTSRVDTLNLELEASGALAMQPGLPLAVTGDLRLADGDTGLGRSRLQVDGTVAPLGLKLRLDAEGDPPGLGRTEVGATVFLGSESVAIEELAIALREGRVTGSGRYAGSGEVDLELTVDELALARWTGEEIGGMLAGRGRLWGRLEEHRYDVDLELYATALQLGGGAVDLEIDAELTRDNSAKVEIKSELGQVTAAGMVDPHGSYALDLVGTLEPQLLLGHPSDPIRVEGELRPDSLATRFAMERLPLPERAFGPLQLGLVWHGQELRAWLNLEGEQLAVNARVDGASGRLDTLVTRVQPLDMARLLPGLSGTMLGELSGDGDLTPGGTRLTGAFQLADLSYQGWHTGPVALEIAHRDGSLRLDLMGAGLAGVARLDSLVAYGGHLRFDDTAFPLVSPQDDTSGAVTVTGEVTWSGRLGAPEGPSVAVDLDSLRYSSDRWRAAALGPIAARIQDRSLQLSPVRFSTPGGPLSVAGSAAGDSVDIAVELTAIDLAAIDGNWQGNGSAELHAAGLLDSLAVRGGLRLRGVSLAGRPLGDLAVDVDLNDSLRIAADLGRGSGEEPELALRFAAPAAVLMAGEGDSAAARFSAGARARGLDLTPFLAHVLPDSVRGQVEAEGSWRGRILSGGRIDWREVSGSLRLDALEIARPGLTLALNPGGRLLLADAALRLEAMDFAVAVEGEEGTRSGGTVALAGTVGLDDRNDLSLVLDRLDLAVVKLLGGGALPEGRIERLDARISGSGVAPQLGVTFDADLPDLGDLVGSARADSTAIELELKWSTLIGDELDLAVRLPGNWPAGELDLDRATASATSEGINLLMFLDLVPQLSDIDGLVSTELELRGFDAAAEVFGSIWIDDLYWRLIDIEPGYYFPSGEIRFAGQRGELSGLVGGPREARGSAEISGFLQLGAEGAAYEVRIAGDDLPFNFDDIFDVPRIDLDLALASTATGTRIAGYTVLEGASVDLPLIDLNAPPVPPPPPAVQDPFLQGMELDLRVEVRNLHLQNEITSVDAEGSTRVYGTFYKPLFQGEVLINQGKVFVLNNEFDFQEGRINLDRLVPSYSILEVAYDPLLLNPELDLGAVATVTPIDEEEEFEITFLLRGPARQVVPRFESNPPLEDKELLMLVAFGSRRSEMALFEEENRGALYSVAGQLLLSRQVKKIGLDEFQLLTSGTILETVGQPAVHVGKYVKWPLPLWLRYEGLTNDMSLGELRLEYKVKPYLTITGSSQSEKERYGLGMGIEKDF